MKDIIDQMEEHIAAIRNIQRSFDYHSKSLEKLIKSLNVLHLENGGDHQKDLSQTNQDVDS